MDVEVIATSAVENLLSRNPYLKTIIGSNDKTPIWDGNIFVYRNRNCNKKNENLIGKVPVQIKGRKVKKIENQNVKFRIDFESIKKFYTDGGVIFFVVYITSSIEKIYYNALLPLDLARLIKKNNQQRTLEIELRSIPMEERALADIFLDFIINSKKQSGTLLSNFLYIDDIENIENEIKQFKFSYSTVEPNNSRPFKELTMRDIYVYMEPKGIGNPIPVDKFSNAIVNIERKLEVAVREQVYFKDAFVQWEKGVPSIRCGKAIRISMPSIEKSGYQNFNFKIIFKGTLDERLRDLCFVRDILENKEISINKSTIPIKNFSFESKRELYKRINDLKLLKQRLKYYGVKTDLDLDKLTDKDNIKLSLIMEEYPPMNKYKIDLSESRLLKMRIANILIILMIEVDEEKGYYKIKDFFSYNWKFSYVLEGTTEHIPISQFLVLDKEDLLADNIDAQRIMDSIKKHHSKNRNIDYVNTLLLEAIKAYDENSAQQAQLRCLIENLSDWLYEESKEDYIFLNLAQVKYRLGELTEQIIDKLISIRKAYQDNIGMLAGISILLDEKELAKDLINKMNEKEKELFMTFPIYYLLENKKVS